MGKKPSKPRKKEKPSVAGGRGRSRNEVFNRLYPIIELGAIDLRAAQQFIRQFLLRDPVPPERRKSDDKSPTIRREDVSLIDWNRTTLFLTEVLGMDKEQIERIRAFADRFAELINEKNDKPLFQTLVYARSQFEHRNALTKAQRNYAKDRNSLLFGLDDFLDVFQADSAVGRIDWSLVRDLISIRLVEKLHASRFFERNKGVLKDEEKTDDSDAEGVSATKEES